MEDHMCALQRLIATSADSLERMGEALSVEDTRLNRLDQARRLDALESGIAREVSNHKGVRACASIAFNVARAIGSLVTRDADSFVMQMLETGAKQMEMEPLVVVGSGGLPDDVEVASRQAAEALGGELPMVEGDGVHLSPTDFHRLMCIVRERVLQGSLSLPVTVSQLASLVTEHGMRT